MSKTSSSSKKAKVPSGGKTYALLIGVDTYAHSSRLRCCENDVSLFESCLYEMDVDRANIIHIGSSSKQLDRRPTFTLINHWLDYCFERLNENDVFIFMFSGHGFEVDGTPYLSTFDSIVTQNGQPKPETAISVDDLIKRLNRSKARFKWLVIDACRVKLDAARGSFGAFGSARLSTPKGCAVFQSCQSGDISIETIDKSQGIFILSLVNGLRGGADYDNDGKITIQDLEKYVKAETPRLAKQHHIDQIPSCSIDLNGADNFVLRDNLHIEGMTYEQVKIGDSLIDEAKKQIVEADFLKKYTEGNRDLVEYISAYCKVNEALAFEPMPTGNRFTEWNVLRKTLLNELRTQELKRRIRKLHDQIEKSRRKTVCNNKLLEELGELEQVFQEFAPFDDKDRNADRFITVKDKDYIFRYCPEGTFQMGSPDCEDGRTANETLCQVTISKAFWILETQVTQRLWFDVMGNNPSHFLDDSGDFPVENVSWFQCETFVEKLNELNVAPEGMSFRIPTEEEWEYACRAGTQGEFARPNLDEVGWYKDNSAKRTHRVQSKLPNRWGIYDMHGNVWEWCSNATESENSPESTSQPLRGGSWAMSADRCRSAARFSNVPGFKANTVGFRIVMVEN